MRHFRELKADGSLWGLFAASIRGRIGYQCSSFYRSLIDQYKITDKRYTRDAQGCLHYHQSPGNPVPPASVRLLVQEAIEFIKSFVGEANGAVVSALAESSADEPLPDPPEHSAPEEPQAPEQASDDGGCHCLVGWRPPRASDGNWSLLRGAADPATSRQMEEPYMDPFAGLVFDYTTWQEVFAGTRSIPDRVFASGIEELVPMTVRNYQQLRLEIRNLGYH
jgi:hypothetical protein